LELLARFSDLDLSKNLIERIVYQYKQKIITKSFFTNDVKRALEILENYKGEHRKILEIFFHELGLDFQEVVDFFTNLIGALDYFGIFLLMTVESSFIPFPSEIILDDSPVFVE